MTNTIGTITTRTLGSAYGFDAQYTLGQTFEINDFVTGERQTLKVVSQPRKFNDVDFGSFWKASCKRIS